MYYYHSFDPRPGKDAENDKLFVQGDVLGIEVTIPRLAQKCRLGNIDPQHNLAAGQETTCRVGGWLVQAVPGTEYTFGNGGNSWGPYPVESAPEGCEGLAVAVPAAAIEAATVAELPPDGTVLATVRPDLDSVGAMAVLVLRKESRYSQKVADRAYLVGSFDSFFAGSWPGRKPLPTRGNPWPETSEPSDWCSQFQGLSAMALAVADFKILLETRVAWMAAWLLTGEIPSGYQEKILAERAEMVEALESGAIKVSDLGGISVVESTHRAALALGYCLVPVVVALNPAFRVQGGEPHRKFTVCQYKAGYVDLRQALLRLNELEPGWGGSPTIIGSPQGVGSKLTTEQVVNEIRDCLVREE